MNQPWLSVIMPTYNGETFLPAALESLACQDQNGFECIAVDDGSSDSTLDILRSYQQRVDLKIISGERIGNWVSGTNKGLRAAQGKFVSFLHQDDLWHRGRTRRLRKLIAENPECSFFAGDADFIDQRGAKVGRWRPPLSARQKLRGAAVLERLIVQDFFAINNPTFRRSRALQLGGLDESLWYTADWDFWLRLMRDECVYYVSESICGFRLHSGSQTITGSRNTQNFRLQLNTVLDRHLANNPQLSTELVSRARLSAEFNNRLAKAYYERSARPLLIAAMKFLPHSPFYQYRFLRDTGLKSRILARLKAL